MKLKYQILISSVLSALGIYLIIRQNNRKQSDISESVNQPITEATTYSVEYVSDFIITKPDTTQANVNVIFVFGGISYATKEWMLKQVPKCILLNNVIVFSNYNSTFSNAKIQLLKYLSDNDLTINDISICGFSAGGIDILDAYNSSYKLVGLIDPSNEAGDANLPFASNTYMIYNDANWTSYARIKAEMINMARNITNRGGYAEKVNLSHEKIPSYFFNKFSYLLC